MSQSTETGAPHHVDVPTSSISSARLEKVPHAAPAARGPWRIVKKFLPLLVLVAAAGGVYGISQIPDRPSDVKQIPPAPANVDVATVRTIVPGSPGAAELRDVYEQSGTVSPNAVVSIAAEVSGVVKTLHKKKGDVVRAGEPLATLDTEFIDAEIQALEASIQSLEANLKAQEATIRGLEAKVGFDRLDLERVKELHSKNAARIFEVNTAETALEGSEASVDAAKAGLEAGKASLDTARANRVALQARLARAVIKAPVDGIVDGPLKMGEPGVGRDIQVGDLLSPGTPLCSIVDVSTMKVAVDIPEQDVPAYTVGQTHEIELGTFGSIEPRRLQATITYISRIADGSAHTTRMELSIPNDDDSLHSGQMATVRLTRRVLDQLIRIPLDAVIPMENGKAVYVAEGARRTADGHMLATARERAVVLGMFSGQKDIQILSGLSDGDVLILPQGNRYVSDGQDIRIIRWEDAQSKPIANSQ